MYRRQLTPRELVSTPCEDRQLVGFVHIPQDSAAGPVQLEAVRMNVRVLDPGPALLCPHLHTSPDKLNPLQSLQHPDFLHFVTILFQ